MRDIKKIEVCCGGDCLDRGAEGILQVLEAEYKKKGTVVEPCSCIGICEKAANVIVDEKEIFSYSKASTIVQNIEKNEGKPFRRYSEENLDLADDFLGDL